MSFIRERLLKFVGIEPSSEERPQRPQLSAAADALLGEVLKEIGSRWTVRQYKRLVRKGMLPFIETYYNGLRSRIHGLLLDNFRELPPVVQSQTGEISSVASRVIMESQRGLYSSRNILEARLNMLQNWMIESGYIGVDSRDRYFMTTKFDPFIRKSA